MTSREQEAMKLAERLKAPGGHSEAAAGVIDSIGEEDTPVSEHLDLCALRQ